MVGAGWGAGLGAGADSRRPLARHRRLHGGIVKSPGAGARGGPGAKEKAVIRSLTRREARNRLRMLLAVAAATAGSLMTASPGIREHVLSQLPASARLLYRTVWLPRYARTTPPL
jgi:hypothetical protein